MKNPLRRVFHALLPLDAAKHGADHPAVSLLSVTAAIRAGIVPGSLHRPLHIWRIPRLGHFPDKAVASYPAAQ